MSDFINLNYSASDVNEGIAGGLEYKTNKNLYALQENILKQELISGNNAFNFTYPRVKYGSSLELIKILNFNYPMFFIDGYITLYNVSEKGEILPKETWIEIGKIKDNNNLPGRGAALTACTTGNAILRSRIIYTTSTTAEFQTGAILLWSNMDISGGSTIYISGMYRGGNING